MMSEILSGTFVFMKYVVKIQKDTFKKKKKPLMFSSFSDSSMLLGLLKISDCNVTQIV